jgi:MOSC domain-containing protein YiiM
MAATLDKDADGNLIRKAGIMSVVLTGGEVRPGDPIALVERPEHGITIAEANRLIYRDRDDTAATERLIAAMDATAAWG